MKKEQTHYEISKIKSFKDNFLFANDLLQWKARHNFCPLVKYGFKELELHLLTDYDKQYLDKKIERCRKQPCG